MAHPGIFRAPPEVHIPYVIAMAQLARICTISLPYTLTLLTVSLSVREVVSSQYLPGRSKLDNAARPMLHQRLVDWESRLPDQLQFQVPMRRDEMFLVGMLHMAYKYAMLRHDIRESFWLTPVQQPISSLIPTSFYTTARPSKLSRRKPRPRCSNAEHPHSRGHALRKPSPTWIGSLASFSDGAGLD